jgi:hypothetical protein
VDALKSRSMSWRKIRRVLRLAQNVSLLRTACCFRRFGWFGGLASVSEPGIVSFRFTLLGTDVLESCRSLVIAMLCEGQARDGASLLCGDEETCYRSSCRTGLIS